MLCKFGIFEYFSNIFIMFLIPFPLDVSCDSYEVPSPFLFIRSLTFNIQIDVKQMAITAEF
jgi:hypothetical protein